jgi:hypothetical protein
MGSEVELLTLEVPGCMVGAIGIGRFVGAIGIIVGGEEEEATRMNTHIVSSVLVIATRPHPRCASALLT